MCRGIAHRARYFTNINVRNTTVINNTNITNVYNNYSNGRPIDNANYAYRRNAAAVTAVSRDTFVGARPVDAARVQVNANNLRNAQVVSRVGIAPTRASFVGDNARARAVPAAAVLDRQVIARSAPPPRPVPIASRLQAIQSNGSQPLQNSQLRQIAARPAVAAEERAQPSRIQVVGRGNAAAPQPLPMRAGSPAQRVGGNESANPVSPRATPNAPVNAERGGVRPPMGTQRTPDARTQPATPARNELPSARFAPRANNPAANVEGNRAAAPVRGNSAVQPQRGAPVNRDNGRGSEVPARDTTMPTRAAPVQRAPVAEPQRNAEQRLQPVQREQQQRQAPVQQREAPVRDNQRSSAPVRMEQRQAPVQQRQAPVQQREAPVRDYQRSSPVQEQRQAPVQQRQAPVQQREAPVRDYQRSAPVQMEQRQAPVQQQRVMPQQQQPPQRAVQPVERRAPPPARDDNKKDKDKDNQH